MRRPIRLTSLAAVLAAAACAASADRQAAFVTRLGNDTVAVERVTRTAETLRAEVVVRVPRTRLRVYEVRFDGAGRPAAMTVSSYDPATGLEREPTETREVDLSEGSGIPFIDYVHWPFDLMIEQARAAGQDSVTLDLVTARRPLPFVVARVGENAYTARHPTRGVMDIEVDGQGRLVSLDASKTTRALRVTRQPTIDISALAREFAARDAAGKPMGELSGRGESTTTVAGAEITLDWGRPLKRGREIFGVLVPWNRVWRTGANEATRFTTSRDLRAGGATIPAGAYTLFTIPRPDGWTLIINKRTNINGQAYDPEHDLVRLEMQVRELPEVVEAFTILAEETPDGGGVLRFQWDRTEAFLPFTVVR
ncbi:MAG TPA: DUF2911 domain-containing protein [Longimicrobiales bacterium]